MNYPFRHLRHIKGETDFLSAAKHQLI